MLPFCGWDQISNGAKRRMIEICEGGSSKNTARTTNTWMTVWRNWCKARSTNVSIDSYDPVEYDGLLTRFYAEIWKRDGSEYGPEWYKLPLRDTWGRRTIQWALLIDESSTDPKKFWTAKQNDFGAKGKENVPTRLKGTTKRKKSLLETWLLRRPHWDCSDQCEL